MIGQGKVLASPLAMAMVAASVDSGVSRTPMLLPGVAPGIRLHQLSPLVNHDMQKMMRLVVTEGTGTAVNLPGLPVYAKTGTAEVPRGNGVGTNAWMIGFRGDIAFAVIVEEGSSGTTRRGSSALTDGAASQSVSLNQLAAVLGEGVGRPATDAVGIEPSTGSPVTRGRSPTLHISASRAGRADLR
jgi:cell division protein FtsI/penicillin-binding protein 2